MRTLLISLLLLIGFTALAATDVLIDLKDARLQAGPSYTNRTVWVQPMTVPNLSSPSVILGAKFIGTTDTNGQWTLTSLYGPMLYYVTVTAPPSIDTFQFMVTATNLGLINAGDNLVANSTATFPAGSVAWAAAVTDQRYSRGSNQPVSFFNVTNALGYLPQPSSVNLSNFAGITTNAVLFTNSVGTAAYSNATAFYLNSNPSNYVSLVLAQLASANLSNWSSLSTNALASGGGNGNGIQTNGGTGINNILTNVTLVTGTGTLSGVHYGVGLLSYAAVSNGIATATIIAAGSNGLVTASNYVATGATGFTGNGGSLSNLNTATNAYNSASPTFQIVAANGSAPALTFCNLVSGFTGTLVVQANTNLLSGMGIRAPWFAGDGAGLVNVDFANLTNVTPYLSNAETRLVTLAGGLTVKKPTIIAPTNTGVALAVFGDSSGANDIFDVETVSGSLRFWIDASGTMHGNALNVTNLQSQYLVNALSTTVWPILAGTNVFIQTNSGSYTISIGAFATNYIAATNGVGVTPTFKGTAASDTMASTNFAGNGGNITNLNASNLASGTVPTGVLGSGTANNLTFHRGDGTWAIPGHFVQPGTGVTMTTNGNGNLVTVNASGGAVAPGANVTVTTNGVVYTVSVTPQAFTNAWQLSGNQNIATNAFLGTIDSNSVVIKAGNIQAARFDNPSNGPAPNAILGNNLAAGVTNGVAIGGGYNNYVGAAAFSTISGGSTNNIFGNAIGYANIAGGTVNTMSNANYSTIGGGLNNTVSNQAGLLSVEGSVVPGGENNVVSASFGLASGRYAYAAHQGAYVWSDSQAAQFPSTNNDSFNVRARGGARFLTAGAGLTVDGSLVTTFGNLANIVTNNQTNVTLAGTFTGQINVTSNSNAGLSLADIYAGKFIGNFWGNGSALTNLAYPTNAITGTSLRFGNAFITNASTDVTISGFVGASASAYESLVIYLYNPSLNDRKLNFPAGVIGPPGSGTPPSIYFTNSTLTRIVVEHYGNVWTNASKIDYGP